MPFLSLLISQLKMGKVCWEMPGRSMSLVCCCWGQGGWPQPQGATSVWWEENPRVAGRLISELRLPVQCPSHPLSTPIVPPGRSLRSQAMWAGWAWGWPQASSQQALAGGSWNHPESSSLLWPLCWPLTLTLSQFLPGPRRGQTTASDVSGPPPTSAQPWTLGHAKGVTALGGGKCEDDRRVVWAGVGRAGARCWLDRPGNSNPNSLNSLLPPQCAARLYTHKHTPRSCLLYRATGPCPRRPREAIT